MSCNYRLPVVEKCLEKYLSPPPKWLNFRKVLPPPPLIRGGGSNYARWLTSLLFRNFLKKLLTSERRPKGPQFLVVYLSPTFLNLGTTNETFQLSGKHESFRHILESFASMYEIQALQNNHSNAIRNRCLCQIKVSYYGLFNQFGSYRNIMLFQISSRRENRWKDTWVIEIRVPGQYQGKMFLKACVRAF